MESETIPNLKRNPNKIKVFERRPRVIIDQLVFTFPKTSDALNINISKTGIQLFKLHETISDSMPGYRDTVTQYLCEK